MKWYGKLSVIVSSMPGQFFRNGDHVELLQ